MFCEKCGTQLLEGADFCTKCGTSTKGEKSNTRVEKIPDVDIQLRVQPTYKFGYMVLPSIIGFGIIILIFSFIFAMISIIAGITVFLISLIIMALILGIKVAINKKQYDSYCYDFYRTKVIYKDSFLNVSEKEVKYKHIREVTMRQTFFQRFFNIGSIILFTNAETGFGNGIYIMSVENVQNVYRDIKAIIDV